MRDSRLVSNGAGALARALAFALLAAAGAACSSNDSTDGGDGGSAQTGDGGGSSTTPTPADAIDESVLAKCPQATTLLETTEWMACVEGKRLTGVEPFTNKPCELRIAANGAFEYRRDNAVALAIPERSAWRNAFGTYQNEASSGPGSRLFLASISPDLAPVEGQPRILGVNVSLFALASQQDTVKVDYMDAALTRQTYNCSVQAL